MTNLTATQLRRALSLRERIDELESELNQVFGNSSVLRAPSARQSGAEAKPSRIGKRKTRRAMSAATKARIAAAARKRWKLAKAAGKRTLGK
jgi:hypothetical protein